MSFPGTIPQLSWSVAMGLEVCASVLVACLTLCGRVGVMFAAMFSAAAVLLPAFVALEPHIARASVVFAGELCMLRLVDLLRGARPCTLAQRVWFVVTPFDTRQISFACSALDADRIKSMAGYASLAMLSAFALIHLQTTVSTPLFIVRWLIGALFCYTAADTIVAAITVGCRLFGVVPPEIHRTPILSTSLREFWGERWNTPVHKWLFRHCFLPLARRHSPILGIATAFIVSTVIHVWIVIGAGNHVAAMMATFFLLQGTFLVIERALGVARWRTLAARCWTIGCLLATSPLFVEPVLRVVGL